MTNENMPEFKYLNLSREEVSRILAGRVGLVVGPGVTLGADSTGELIESLSQQFGVEPQVSVRKTVEESQAAGYPSVTIKRIVDEFVGKRAAPIQSQNLSEVRWSAILSLSLDSNLEDQLRVVSERDPAWPDISMVTNYRIATPPRTMPVFKLSGTLTDGTWASNTTAFEIRKAQWDIPIRSFCDYVKGAPIVVAGVEECESDFYDLLARFVAFPNTMFAEIVIDSRNPILNSQRFQEFIEMGVNVRTYSGSFGEMARLSRTLGRTDRQVDSSARTNVKLDLKSEFKDIALLTGDILERRIDISESARMIDALFSPNTPNWEPFHYNLELRRTLCDEIAYEINKQIDEDERESVAILITGTAACGKTTAMKRMAYDVAENGNIVVWIRPSVFPDAVDRTRKFFSSLKGKLVDSDREGTMCVIFFDDPMSGNVQTTADIASIAGSCNLNILLVASVRSSDVSEFEISEFTGGLPLLQKAELPDELDVVEMENLPACMIGIGFARDEADAEEAINRLGGQTTKDTLNLLYYLMPETRYSIRASIQEEYARIGGYNALSNMLGAEHSGGNALIRRAYEMAAVASRYRTPLPIEVLVSALGVSYPEWLEHTTANSGGPIYGLLYEDSSPDGQTICFYTRNAVVNDIVVKLVNGGTLSRKGEVRVLREMLSACTGTSLMYREFCVNVLVKTRAINGLECEDGVSLFDAAIGALPFEDKTLEHQKGRWLRKEGADPIDAIRQLTKALETKVYPNASKTEMDEHIHTSLASTYVRAIREGKIDADEGASEVKTHLLQARSQSFYNPYAVHVQGELIYKLLRKVKTYSDVDKMELINEALSDVDKLLLSLHGSKREGLEVSKDSEMIQEIRGKLLNLAGEISDLEESAVVMWENNRSQIGFVVAARAKYERASDTNKGSDYNLAYKYVEGVIEEVKKQGDAVSVSLVECALHIYYHWRVKRKTQNYLKDRATVEWGIVEELVNTILGSARYYQDPFYAYIYAVALSHNGNWAAANSVFAQNRRHGMPTRVLWRERDYLRNIEGLPARVQGEMKTVMGKRYVHSEELRQDFVASYNQTWPRDGELAHAYLVFSYAGITATNEL